MDDVSQSFEPGFRDGIISEAVDEVVAGGSLYFSSAGNYRNGYKFTSVSNLLGNLLSNLLSNLLKTRCLPLKVVFRRLHCTLSWHFRLVLFSLVFPFFPYKNTGSGKIMVFSTKTHITYFAFLFCQKHVGFASLLLALMMFEYFIPLG